MVTCICTDKIRDKNGRIVAYQLKDGNNNYICMEARQLKFNILTRRLRVLNLKLTADGKLIDADPNEALANANANNAIRGNEEALLKLFNKMIRSRITKREAYEMLNLLNKVYGLKIQLIDSKYRIDSAEDYEVEASCGNMFIIVDDVTFGVINYEMAKYQGNYEELVPRHIACVDNASLYEIGKNKLTLEGLRETARFMKENQCELDYKKLNNKLVDIMHNAVEHIAKKEYMGADLEAYHTLEGDLHYGIKVKGTDRNIINVAVQTHRYGDYKPNKYVIFIDNNIRRDVIYLDFNDNTDTELANLKKAIDKSLSDYLHYVDINRHRFIRDEAEGVLCYMFESMDYKNDNSGEMEVTLIKRDKTSSERVVLSYEAVAKALQGRAISVLGLMVNNGKLIDVRY